MSEDTFVDPDEPEVDERQAESTDLNTAVRALLEQGYTVERYPPPRFASLHDTLHRVISPTGDVIGRVPTFSVSALFHELGLQWTVHDDWLGITSNDGRYVEFLLSRSNSRLRVVRDDYISPRALCSSAVNGQHPSEFSTAYGPTNVVIQRDGPFKRALVILHVGNGLGDCVEISAPSARLYAAYAEHADRWQFHPVRHMNSIKIRFREASAASTATEKARDLASTIIFEQAAMRNASFLFHEPLMQRKRIPLPRLSGDLETRFPPQFVDRRASALFVSADQTGGTLSRYLAYYQTIEYFLPFSDERESIIRLKAEIFSPGFNLGNDRSLLSLAHIIGRQAVKTERESFRDLVLHVVTDEKAKKIYDAILASYPDAFSKRSRLKNLPFIHPNDSTRSLRTQIADRIYSLRCRIVHSKAAGGTVGVEPLFASDDEVTFVDADLDLVRLVAIETVTVFAVANSMV